jgi:hypothetical protein
MPSEVDVSVVRSQLAAVCSDPLWIDDADLCAEVADSLQVIDDRLESGDIRGAEGAIVGARSILWEERVPAGQVGWNAQWLLRTNLGKLLMDLPGRDSGH